MTQENKIDVAVKGIITYNNKVLIVQRSEDDEIGAQTWEFVGGKLEFGETLGEALIREVKEEAGLEVNISRLLYASTFNTSMNRQVVILTYLCIADNNETHLSSEHKNYLWANKEQMMKLLPSSILDDLNHNSVCEIIFKE